MNFIKKILGISLLLSGMVVAGCSFAPIEIPDQSEEEDDENENDGRRVVKFEVLKAGLGTEVYKNLERAYEAEHPDVNIKCIFNYQVNEEIGARLDSGSNLADLYSIRDLSTIRDYYILGKIRDLTDIYDQEIENGKTLRQLMDPEAVEYCEYNGHQLCVPEYTNVNGFVYNKKLFDQYHWAVPETTEQLVSLAQQILTDTSGRVKPFIYCGNDADGYLYYLLNSINASYKGLANMKEFLKFESAENFKPDKQVGKRYALECMKEWFFENKTPQYIYGGSIGLKSMDAQQALLQDKAAMMLNGSWFENEMANFLDENNDIAMFRVPEYSVGGIVQREEGYTSSGGKKLLQCEYTANYFIPAAAANRADAIDFLKFINRSDMCILYTKTCNSIRPLAYDKDPSSSTYASMSNFGKSVLNIANTNYLYVPSTKNSLALQGKISLWPNPGDPYHYKALLRDNETPNDCLTREYNFAKSAIV